MSKDKLTNVLSDEDLGRLGDLRLTVMGRLMLGSRNDYLALRAVNFVRRHWLWLSFDHAERFVELLMSLDSLRRAPVQLMAPLCITGTLTGTTAVECDGRALVSRLLGGVTSCTRALCGILPMSGRLMPQCYFVASRCERFTAKMVLTSESC